IMAMRALGIVDSLDVAADLAPATDIVRPSAATTVYTRLLPLYAQLADTLEPAFDALASLRPDLPELGPPASGPASP
ncbi:MAG: gluconokinase, partial [Mycobacteriales bacterium]